ncbi:uncharacterized protein LOC126367632 [Pectinophora gossypiella]|uniref:uncharacterized protein LOC126367632 n=1 Tax=Pectinophora gossypiella TaxID=13191 RepID=UPI00214EB7AF|nr:uncharacterized protein LOC126367632 [Pectinophora gossypiella]
MTTVYSNISTFSRFNLDETESDIQVFIKEYRERVNAQLNREMEKIPTPFLSFHETKLQVPPKDTWLKDNQDRFFKDTPNEFLIKESYLSEMGYLTSMIYSPGGEYLIVGHSTGLIQMRHGRTGTVLATLRNIQFPPKAVYALEYSKGEERICYAACTDGAIYRIEIPNIDTGADAQAEFCIRADPALEWLNTQFYSSPGMSLAATPFITQRSPALSVGVPAENTKIIAGYADTSTKIFDIETQEVVTTFKVHKLRLQFIPKKLQRVHHGQVCALRCHPEKPTIFATAAWDKTLRIWDTRCKVGCMMTFEDVDICHDSIDLNREQCISGSWQTTEALNVWDLVARKRLNIIRVQNRRPDVDGEYIYACRYWRSSDYNRKGKYGIIGGSGTGCVEVINLHNRYITCSYPAPGSVLAIASHGDRIAFGGTAPVFNIVSFHDPKHEKYRPETEPEYNYADHPITMFDIHLDYDSASSMTEENIRQTRKSRISNITDISRARVSVVEPMGTADGDKK